LPGRQGEPPGRRSRRLNVLVEMLDASVRDVFVDDFRIALRSLVMFREVLGNRVRL
jgi:hypothetical protein